VSKLSKFEYNKYLNELPFKKGDYVVGASIDNYDRLTIWAIYKVKDIQEIHYLVEYDPYSNPLCIELESTNEASRFWATPSRWKLAPEELLFKLGVKTKDEDVNTRD
jgi:hypothetical protein